MEDEDWAAADSFFDKALDMDAECAEAYFGKALAAAKCSNGNELAQQRMGIPVTNSEKLFACERALARVEQAVKENSVPGYFTEETARACFSFDERTYDSLTSAWKQRITEEKEYWERDRQMSRALPMRRASFPIRFDPCRAELKQHCRVA